MSGAIITTDKDKSVLSQKVVVPPAEVAAPQVEVTTPPAEVTPPYISKTDEKMSFYNRHKLLLLMIVFILIIYLLTGSIIKTMTIGAELFIGFGILSAVLILGIIIYWTFQVPSYMR